MDYRLFSINNDASWLVADESRGILLRWKDIISYETTGANDFIFGIAELDPGDELPLHQQSQAETLYFLSGEAQVRLGARKVEVGPASAAYFPSLIPHAIKSLGPDPLVYLYTYSTSQAGQEINSKPITEEDANRFDILNLPDTRWAVSEDFESWVSCEPTKGDGVRVRFLFDETRGKHAEMQVGIGEIGSNIHYTLHYHAMPEIYYVLGGNAIVYIGEEKVNVSPGDTLYLPANIVHGIDNLADKPLRLYYIYGLEAVGSINWQETWKPVEDIYTHPRRK